VRQVLQDRQSGEVRVVDVPSPALLPGGLLVATRASLISAGTERATVELGAKSLVGKARARPDLVRKVFDSLRTKGLTETLATVRARLAEPSLLGYSAAGVVLAVGDGVDGYGPGDRVACAGQGIASHAEVNFVPRKLAVPLPAPVDFEAGAFVALGAIALHGVRTAGVAVGDQVAVVGLGLVGLLTVQVLKASGCSVYGLDPVPERAALGRDLGADVGVGAADDLEAAVLEGTGGRGVDAVLLTASTPSNEPIRLAAEIARDRGTVCVVGDVGLEVPREAYYRKELALRISRSYGPGRYDPAYELLGHSYPPGFVPWDQRRNMESVLAMLADKRLLVEPLIGARFPVERAPEAYGRLTRRDGEASPVAVILTYPVAERPARAPAVVLRGAQRPGRGIAVIGAGRFAQATLLPRLARARDWRRVIAVTTSGQSAHTAARQFEFERAGTDVEEAFADPDVGAVFIATRHDTHAGLAARALRAGLPVFVEKPLAITLEGLREVMTAVRDSGNDRVTVGFNRRFAPFGQAMAAHFAGAAQAASYRVNAGPLPPDHWTRVRDVGGGRLIGEGCHFVDFLGFLTGGRVVEVHCHALAPADGGSEDTMQVNLRYDTGAVGHLLYVATGEPRQPKERVEAFGHGRSAVLENFERLELWRHGRRTIRRARLAPDKGFDTEVAAFLAACQDPSRPMPIPLDVLVNTTLATLSAERAVVERRAVTLAELMPE
jgi:predicted dehydrogenase